MIRRTMFCSILVLVGIVGLTVGAAGSSVPIGSLIVSKNVILNGQAPLPHTTVLSGDTLEVGDGVAMVALEQGNRMILGRGTTASFFRESDGVAVSLGQGNISFYHPEAGTRFRVKIGDITVAPAHGYKTLGELAVVDGLLVMTAKDGVLQVEKAGTTQEIGKGKTITIATTVARSPLPDPGGTPHISTSKVLVVTAILAAGTATALSIIAIHRANEACEQVSPFVPSSTACQ